MTDIRLYKEMVGVSMYNSSFYWGGQHVVFMLLDTGTALGTNVEYDNEMAVYPSLIAGNIFTHLYYSRLPLSRSSVIDGPVTGNVCFNMIADTGSSVVVTRVTVEMFYEDNMNKRYTISGGEVKINHAAITHTGAPGPAEKVVGLYFEFPVYQKLSIPNSLLCLKVSAHGYRTGTGSMRQLVSKDDKDILVSIPLIGA